MRATCSPFPGMDPYLEGYWNNVHGALTVYIADKLNEILPIELRATLRERKVDQDDLLTWRGRRVACILSRSERLTQYSVEIVEARFSEKVITAIEVLSPENKRTGDGMQQFLKKQEDYRRSRVSRVEIDLLREGRRLFDFPQRMLKPEQVKPYYVTVYRGHKVGEGELYAIDLRDPLPVISIPLRPQDADVQLDLQPLIEHVYRTGRFPIDYDDPCDPPLEGDDGAWARQLLDSKSAQN